MPKSIEEIKDLLVKNGFEGFDENTLQELAEEIAESTEGLRDQKVIANTIHGNLVASGVSFKDADNFMSICENIASYI